MNCPQCQELIQQHLDGSPCGETPELHLHFAECASCAALHAASQRLSGGLRLLARPQPSRELTDRLVASLLEDQRVRRKQGRLRLTGLALAACLLLSLGAIGLYFSGMLTFGNGQPVVVETIPTPRPDEIPAPGTPSPSVRESMNEAGSALAALTTRTADETVGHTRLFVPMVTGPTLEELDMPPALEPTKSYLEAGQGVTVALEPVTTSARRAVELFRRDLPQMERDTRQKPQAQARE